ncbi:MAG: insulinase family protein, partial [Verrucomicrobia bacterium]|nr:insulinase family protein [Verrucomicrobiota bacterium]
LTLIHETLQEFKETKPGGKELRQARDYLIGQLDLHLENTENHMIWLGEQILGYGHYITVETIRDRLTQTTPEHIRATAREYFQPQHLNLAVVGKVAKHRFSCLGNWLA